ncbi:MAG: hypothetical protein Q9208_007844 [Pyrenodesmia sp. 3 TL-2023]
MSNAQFKDMVNDLAVTCRLHPTSLGVDAEEDGRLSTGQSLGIKVERVENVLSESPVAKPQALHDGAAIPGRVVNIRVHKSKIRAVLVVEHKNLATALEWTKNGTKDVLIVIWAGPTKNELLKYQKDFGFTTWAVREAQKHPKKTQDALQKSTQDRWAKVDADLQRILGIKCTPKQRTLYTNYFCRLGLLEGENTLRREMEAMVASGNVS